MEVLKLRPVGKDYLWGGNRLKSEFGKEIDLNPLAETWECSIHPDGESTILDGKFSGQTLDAVLKKNGQYLGSKNSSGDLPILIKFIDAQNNLSVQVHPDDEYAWEHEGQNGKTEMWYVLDAVPGAHLIYGFEHDVSAEILEKAVKTGTLEKHLHKESVQKGDCIFVPAGMIHGIGAGALLVEIQESSNVTYRVYDYERIDKHGKKRELHLDKALRVLNMNKVNQLSRRKRLIHFCQGYSREILCRCKYFETELLRIKTSFLVDVNQESFQVILCTEGNGMIDVVNKHLRITSFERGDCLFLPAGLGRCNISGNAELLRIRC